jgi:malonate transporter and related proteins
LTWAIAYKLLAVMLAVALDWFAGRMRWLGDNDPARVLSNAAFYIFVPALLFRTTARQDFASMPWGTLAAYFVPALAFLFAVYAFYRWRVAKAAVPGTPVALPSVRAISATFGNGLQVGLPMAAAIFGEAGLAIHVTLISLHALILLSVLTTLVELDLARERALADASASLARTLRLTLRNTVIHPVVLPVVAGLAWNGLGLSLPPVVDETLQMLGTGVVPLCLVLIGMSLAYYGLRGGWRGAVAVSALKLLVLPAVVLLGARFGFGLQGLPLSVAVMMAAMPIGSNALIFAQRYGALEAETTAAIVVSTLAFMVTAPLWLSVLARFNNGP